MTARQNPPRELDCSRAAELLPWFLNRTLEAEEKRLLDEHLAACESCRRELSQTREAMAIFSSHVPSLDLAQHAHGLETEGLDRETIEKHLASCPLCRREFKDMTKNRIVDFPVAARTRVSRPRPSRSRGPWRRLALAAGFAIAILTGGWLYELTSRSAAPAAEDVATEPSVAMSPVNAAGRPGSDQLDPQLLFSDGFESGSTAAWSNVSM